MDKRLIGRSRFVSILTASLGGGEGEGKNSRTREFTSGPPTGSYLGKFTVTRYRNRFFERSFRIDNYGV